MLSSSSSRSLLQRRKFQCTQPDICHLYTAPCLQLEWSLSVLCSQTSRIDSCYYAKTPFQTRTWIRCSCREGTFQSSIPHRKKRKKKKERKRWGMFALWPLFVLQRMESLLTSSTQTTTAQMPLSKIPMWDSLTWTRAAEKQLRVQLRSEYLDFSINWNKQSSNLRQSHNRPESIQLR